ncbi:hypothetical protein Y1Q_0012824 [Alligator mississippiensis]|uniref:Uncharacterized protein n=1 Tax=Alligator mississippiensis TaxID=8496 RepID=A0A151P8C2_ALLMI|nr:hypothetical protein Y1Q_0012824 [Alligator mississippiensis]
MTQMSVDPDCTLHITMLTLVNAGTYKLQVLGPGATYPLVSTDLCVYGLAIRGGPCGAARSVPPVYENEPPSPSGGSDAAAQDLYQELWT